MFIVWGLGEGGRSSYKDNSWGYDAKLVKIQNVKYGNSIPYHDHDETLFAVFLGTCIGFQPKAGWPGKARVRTTAKAL